MRSASALRMICVGHNWAFGKGRPGNVALLSRSAKSSALKPWRSSRWRSTASWSAARASAKRWKRGILKRPAVFWARDYTILGTVQPARVEDDGIGFPTANLSAHNERFPPNGVYAVRVLYGLRLAGWCGQRRRAPDGGQCSRTCSRGPHLRFFRATATAMTSK